jgi:hypothetical protein
MIGIADPGQAETDLAGGMLTCPSRTGPLQPWSGACGGVKRSGCAMTRSISTAPRSG